MCVEMTKVHRFKDTKKCSEYKKNDKGGHINLSVQRLARLRRHIWACLVYTHNCALKQARLGLFSVYP